MSWRLAMLSRVAAPDDEVIAACASVCVVNRSEEQRCRVWVEKLVGSLHPDAVYAINGRQEFRWAEWAVENHLLA